LEKQEFISLIDRYLEGKATELEEQQLAIYAHSFQGQDWDEEKHGSQAEAVARMRSNLLQKVEAQPGHRIHPFRKSWVRYAASIILAISLASTLFILQPWKSEPTEVAFANPLKDVRPGTNKAYITLGNGEQKTIDDIKVGERVGNAVKTADGKLTYINSNAQTLAYNTVTVPRGGVPQFVELPDHTLVWLNTASSITYPTAFTGNTRDVKMTGEVYYEVAKEKNYRHFFAQTRTDKIEVTGTHFNIRAYDDEPNVQTTLLEGQVKIGKAILAPGDQYENGNIKKINATEIERIMAWKNGLFSYDHVDVQTLMRDLGRYYDVDVLFEGQPTKRTFEGKIGRSLTLKEVLEGLQFTELNYRLEKGGNGNRVIMLP
jgi:transmembrane sensor